ASAHSLLAERPLTRFRTAAPRVVGEPLALSTARSLWAAAHSPWSTTQPLAFGAAAHSPCERPVARFVSAHSLSARSSRVLAAPLCRSLTPLRATAHSRSGG